MWRQGLGWPSAWPVRGLGQELAPEPSGLHGWAPVGLLGWAIAAIRLSGDDGPRCTRASDMLTCLSIPLPVLSSTSPSASASLRSVWRSLSPSPAGSL